MYEKTFQGTSQTPWKSLPRWLCRRMNSTFHTSSRTCRLTMRTESLGDSQLQFVLTSCLLLATFETSGCSPAPIVLDLGSLQRLPHQQGTLSLCWDLHVLRLLPFLSMSCGLGAASGRPNTASVACCGIASPGTIYTHSGLMTFDCHYQYAHI